MNLEEWKRAASENAALRAAAESPEAGKALAGLDASAAEDALRRGDAAALRAMLDQVLRTAEGRRLAQAVQDAVKGNG